MTEVTSPATRRWFYEWNGEMVPWQGDLIDKSDIKPTDDQAVDALQDMINKVNQTVAAMQETRNMSISTWTNDDGIFKAEVEKKWGPK